MLSIRQSQMTKGLTEALALMARGRNDLVKTYTEKNSDRYRYSFRYHSSPTAIKIAGSLLDHQWLDKQLWEAHDIFNRKEISNIGMNMFTQTIQKMSILRGEKILFEGYDSLLGSKISALKVLLANSESMNEKLRTIEFDYCRDKVLFEREMNRYIQEINQNQ